MLAFESPGNLGVELPDFLTVWLSKGTLGLTQEPGKGRHSPVHVTPKRDPTLIYFRQPDPKVIG